MNVLYHLFRGHKRQYLYLYTSQNAKLIVIKERNLVSFDVEDIKFGTYVLLREYSDGKVTRDIFSFDGDLEGAAKEDDETYFPPPLGIPGYTELYQGSRSDGLHLYEKDGIRRLVYYRNLSYEGFKSSEWSHAVFLSPPEHSVDEFNKHNYRVGKEIFEYNNYQHRWRIRKLKAPPTKKLVGQRTGIDDKGKLFVVQEDGTINYDQRNIDLLATDWFVSITKDREIFFGDTSKGKIKDGEYRIRFAKGRGDFVYGIGVNLSTRRIYHPEKILKVGDLELPSGA